MSREKWEEVVATVNIPRTMHPTMWPFNDAQEGIAWADAELTRLRTAGCQCICHKHPEHFPFHLLKDIPALIRGHKSHWQETFDKVQRDQLLEDVAKHVEAAIRGKREGG